MFLSLTRAREIRYVWPSEETPCRNDLSQRACSVLDIVFQCHLVSDNNTLAAVLWLTRTHEGCPCDPCNSAAYDVSYLVHHRACTSQLYNSRLP